MNTINIKQKQFLYSIKRKSIKSINMRLVSSNSFYISCPRLTPSFILNNFLKSHLNWIYKNSQNLTNYPKLSKLNIINILDQKYLVRIIFQHKQKIIFDHKNKFIKIYAKKITQKNLGKLIQKHFKPLAQTLIENEIVKIGKFSKLIKISVRNQKSRFGSCSSKGHLSFNWQIILFPKDKFRHIICHELTHLTVNNHQKSFYLALSLLDLNWEQNNTWLKTDAKKFFLIKP